VGWMKERTGQWPVTLLDEVMAELDVQRRKDLLHYVGAGGQAMLTATDAGMFAEDFLRQAQVWQVVEGSLHR
jgi:DNA replication and repair protein RecF